MSTPRRRYRVDVCRDNAGDLHAMIRTRPEALPWVWCRHSVRARSNASARAKALQAHIAHEAVFLTTMRAQYPVAEALRKTLEHEHTEQCCLRDIPTQKGV